LGISLSATIDVLNLNITGIKEFLDVSFSLGKLNLTFGSLLEQIVLSIVTILNDSSEESR
jgi:hypothetical protein